MFIQVGTLLTVIIVGVKSCKVGEVTGFGNERSFARAMPQEPNCIRLGAGPEAMKWKQQLWVVYFGKLGVEIWK